MPTEQFTCEQCGKPFWRYCSPNTTRVVRFCSRACDADSKRLDRIYCGDCVVCGAALNLLPCEMRRNQKHGHATRYCSEACKTLDALPELTIASWTRDKMTFCQWVALMRVLKSDLFYWERDPATRRQSWRSQRKRGTRVKHHTRCPAEEHDTAYHGGMFNHGEW